MIDRSELKKRFFAPRLTPATVALALVAAFVFGAVVGWAGQDSSPADVESVVQHALGNQRQEFDEAVRNARDNLDALAQRLGQLQAHVIRLDALGERLVKMAGLEADEFDFGSIPPQGGPHSGASERPAEVPDFLSDLNGLSQQLEDREYQLTALETLLMNRNLQKEIIPAGSPASSGWVSSYFGRRTDPFTGRFEYHEGIDVAGKAGSDVVAVASGVVTWAGDRYGYGRLVEINHGNGYATRYGHNQSLKVRVGQTVRKGDVIALMGSTGRSTGPHVHFEVLHNGRPVDPSKYMQAAN